MLREVLSAGEPDQLRAVDVHDVEADRDACGSPSFGHELVGDEVRRHLIEDMGYLERQAIPAEPARRLEGKTGNPP